MRPDPIVDLAFDLTEKEREIIHAHRSSAKYRQEINHEKGPKLSNLLGDLQCPE